MTLRGKASSSLCYWNNPGAPIASRSHARLLRVLLLPQRSRRSITAWRPGRASYHCPGTHQGIASLPGDPAGHRTSILPFGYGTLPDFIGAKQQGKTDTSDNADKVQFKQRR